MLSLEGGRDRVSINDYDYVYAEDRNWGKDSWSISLIGLSKLFERQSHMEI